MWNELYGGEVVLRPRREGGEVRRHRPAIRQGHLSIGQRGDVVQAGGLAAAEQLEDLHGQRPVGVGFATAGHRRLGPVGVVRVVAHPDVEALQAEAVAHFRLALDAHEVELVLADDLAGGQVAADLFLQVGRGEVRADFAGCAG